MEWQDDSILIQLDDQTGEARTSKQLGEMLAQIEAIVLTYDYKVRLYGFKKPALDSLIEERQHYLETCKKIGEEPFPSEPDSKAL